MPFHSPLRRADFEASSVPAIPPSHFSFSKSRGSSRYLLAFANRDIKCSRASVRRRRYDPVLGRERVYWNCSLEEFVLERRSVAPLPPLRCSIDELPAASADPEAKEEPAVETLLRVPDRKSVV